MSARTTNVKLQPDRFNRITGPAARTFRRSLVQRGSKPDDRGFSFADCLLREDEGNTGQVVAELKVVTSNKLCEPIL